MSVGSAGGNMNKSVGLHSIGLTTLDYDLPLAVQSEDHLVLGAGVRPIGGFWLPLPVS